jgi:hypothetical protein
MVTRNSRQRRSLCPLRVVAYSSRYRARRHDSHRPLRWVVRPRVGHALPAAPRHGRFIRMQPVCAAPFLVVACGVPGRPYGPAVRVSWTGTPVRHPRRRRVVGLLVPTWPTMHHTGLCMHSGRRFLGRHRRRRDWWRCGRRGKRGSCMPRREVGVLIVRRPAGVDYLPSIYLSSFNNGAPQGDFFFI